MILTALVALDSRLTVQSVSSLGSQQCSIFGKTGWITPPNAISIFILKVTKKIFVIMKQSYQLLIAVRLYCPVVMTAFGIPLLLP